MKTENYLNTYGQNGACHFIWKSPVNGNESNNSLNQCLVITNQL